VGLHQRRRPPAIQGPEDAAACLPGLLALFDEAALREGVDAIVIGCFDDTGLDPAAPGRSPSSVWARPRAAAPRGRAALPRRHDAAVSVPVIEENIRAMGLWPAADRSGPRACPVLDLPERIGRGAGAAIDGVLAEDPGAAIVLGCAGMSQIVTALRGAATAPLVDPVRAAIAMAVAQAEATAAQGG
jgi:allantoin racemase